MVGGDWQWLAVAAGGLRLAVGGWWLAVGGPLGRSLRAVLNKKKNPVPKGPHLPDVRTSLSR